MNKLLFELFNFTEVVFCGFFFGTKFHTASDKKKSSAKVFWEGGKRKKNFCHILRKKSPK
jgi:hypothetical protein